MSHDELSKDIEKSIDKIPPEVLESMEKGKLLNHGQDYINAIARYEGVSPDAL